MPAVRSPSSSGAPTTSLNATEVNVGLVGVGVVGSAVADYFAQGPLELRLPGSPFGAPATVQVNLRSAARRSRDNPKAVTPARLSRLVSKDEQGRPRFYHDGAGGEGPAWRKVVRDEEVDIVVELMGSPVAEAVMEEALWSGKSVVTANKTVLARSGYELVKLAQARGGILAFEASVGGGMPIVQTIASSIGGRVTALLAIINGTTNYILTCMQRDAAETLSPTLPQRSRHADVSHGRERVRGQAHREERVREQASYPAAVCDAIHRGLAESDPGADVLGEDARSKLIVLAGLAFGVRLRPQDVYVRGIARRGVLRGPAASQRAAYHRCPGTTPCPELCGHDDHLTTQPVLTLEDLRMLGQFGYVPKLLAGAQQLPDGRVAAWVQPSAVPATHPLARVTGSENACLLSVESPTEQGVKPFELFLRGPGAGGPETASSVIADIEFCARQIAVARQTGSSGSLYMYGGAAFDRPQPTTGHPALLHAQLRAPFILRFSAAAGTGVAGAPVIKALSAAGVRARPLQGSARYLRTEPATVAEIELALAAVLKARGAEELSLDILYLPLLEGAAWQ